MTKQETQVLKGVAILFMIFCHIIAKKELYVPLLEINGQYLEWILAASMQPVPFFLILGGYGLWKVNEKNDPNRWRRILRLYLHWWIIMIIFVAIGHFIIPEKYPDNLKFILFNVTGYWPTYNATMWFLLPYAILSLSAIYIFKLMKKFKIKYIILVVFAIDLLVRYIIRKNGEMFLFNHQHCLYVILKTFHLLFNFSLGAMAARYNLFSKIKNHFKDRKYTRLFALGSILCLVGINCVFRYDYFYSFLFIACFLLLKLPSWANKILSNLGDESMNMWMIHGWFCFYLFPSFTYSFKYPIIIFIVLTSISYICSKIINRICFPIERLFMTNKEIIQKPIL